MCSYEFRVASCVLKRIEELKTRNTKLATRNILLLRKYFCAVFCENLRPNLCFLHQSHCMRGDTFPLSSKT
jgi:hypothetical protein